MAVALATGKAAVLTAPGRFEIRDVALREPGEHEALCRVRAVAICGSDPEIVRGDLAGTWPPSYPFVAGHEWAGEVVAVGPGANGLQPGDRVAGEAHKGCGLCRNCLEGRYTICLNYGKVETGHCHYGFTVHGAYAQYNTYSVKSLTPMPAGVSFREGAMVDTAGVSLHALELTGITPGGTVAVIGPGPIGMMVMRLAKALGAAETIVVGRNPRLETARQLGCEHAVDFERTDPVAAVRAITGGFGVDEAFECSGAPGTMDEAIRMVKKGGRIGLIGVPPESLREPVAFKHIVHDEIAIFGSRADPNVAHKVLAMMASRRLAVKEFVTHTFPLEAFGEAMETFVTRKGHALKVVIEPNGSEETS